LVVENSGVTVKCAEEGNVMDPMDSRWASERDGISDRLEVCVSKPIVRINKRTDLCPV
jgi:hypothetical protein